MNNDKTNEKSKQELYPISVNNQHCVGPCYYSNTKIIHPLTLDEIKNVDHNFCPTGPFVFTDPTSKVSRLSNIDKCTAPTAKETLMDDTLRNAVIAPQFHFSSEYFVKVYYKIQNLEDLLKWLDSNKHDPYKTRERVFNNGMIVYGGDMYIVDHRLVHFINDVMIENLPIFYRKLKRYIQVNSSGVSLIKQSDYDKLVKYNDNDIADDIETIRKIRSYIKEKFLGSDNIHQFMSKFIRYYKEEITSLNLSNVLVMRFNEYCIKRISATISEDSL